MQTTTHVIIKDAALVLGLFSLRSVDTFVLRFAHPSAVRRTAEATRGRAFGARPHAFSRLGDNTDGTGTSTLGLTCTDWSAWLLMNARFSSSGDGCGEWAHSTRAKLPGQRAIGFVPSRLE